MKRKLIALLLGVALLAGVFSVGAGAADVIESPVFRGGTDIFRYSPEAARWLDNGLNSSSKAVAIGCDILYTLLRPDASIVHWFRGLSRQADPEDIFLFVSDSRSKFNPANQDGNIAIDRDKNGELWAVSGHTAGNGEVKEPLTVYKGTTVDNLAEVYKARLNFATGNAGEAFNGTRYYPGGPYARGAIWPMGLFIDDSGKWWAYCHNETAWHISDGSWYNVYGAQEGEPDFRAMCVISSADNGRTWDFVRWALVQKSAMYSNHYVPPEVEDPSDFQPGPQYDMGEGDASIFVNDADGYVYLFYTHATINTIEVCVARAPKDDPAALMKYHNGAWESPGVKGEATPVLSGVSLIPTVAYSTFLEKYVMFLYDGLVFKPGALNACPAIYSVSDDLLHWSQPRPLATPGGIPSDAYFSVYNTGAQGNPKHIGKEFVLFHNLWSGPVSRMVVTTAGLDESDR